MSTNYEKVVLGNIEQGVFMADANDALAAIETALIEHVAVHGKTKEAEAGIVMKVKIKHREGAYVIVTDIDKKLPKKPSGVTAAMISDDPADGHDTLFCQQGGTHQGNPNQAMLCQENGATLQETPEN